MSDADVGVDVKERRSHTSFTQLLGLEQFGREGVVAAGEQHAQTTDGTAGEDCSAWEGCA